MKIKRIRLTPILSLAAIIGSLLTSITTMAGEDVDSSLDAEPDGSVRIINTRGDVDIHGWDKDEIRVAGELDSLAEELIFEVKGSRTLIEVKLPKSNINWGDGSDLDIYVPRRSSVVFEGVSTDTTIEDIAGGLRLRSVSGDVSIESVEKLLFIKAVSGDIEISASSGKASISTVSGEIEVEIESLEITLDTVSGGIEAELAEFSSLRANAVSGDVRIEGQLGDDGMIDIASVSGDISLRLQAPVNAALNIETGPGGEIVNGLSDDEPVDKFPARMELNTHLGTASGEIKMRTVSGDVRIDD